MEREIEELRRRLRVAEIAIEGLVARRPAGGGPAARPGESLDPLARRIAQLADDVRLMARVTGQRLTAAQLAARLGIHRNTLRHRMAEPGFPKPDRERRWLLDEIIEWEHLHRD